MNSVICSRIFLLFVCFQLAENAKLSEDVKREIYDPNEFEEEIDPYIPISDFPVDRKKRDAYDYQPPAYDYQPQQYQPQTAYHSSGPVYNHPDVYPIEQDPYRPNEPSFLGRLFFGKVKKVANLIDKKAKFFLQNFPADQEIADEDPFTGGFYPWSTPSTSYSIHENSGLLSSKPVHFNKPDVTYTYSTKVGNAGTTTYNNRPIHSAAHTVPSTSSSSTTYSHRPVQTITKSIPSYSTSSYSSRPDQTVKKISSSITSSSYIPNSSSSYIPSSSSIPSSTSIPSSSSIPSSTSIPSSSSTTYTTRPSTSNHIKGSVPTTSKVSNTAPSIPRSNSYSNSPIQTITKGSDSIHSSSSNGFSSNTPVETVSNLYSTVSTPGNSISLGEDVMDILPVKISPPTFMNSSEESFSKKTPVEEISITNMIDENIEEDNMHKFFDLKDDMEMKASEQTNEDISINKPNKEDIPIADSTDETGLLEAIGGAKKNYGPILFPENLAEAWTNFAAEHTDTLQNIFMEEMIDEVFSINSTEIELEEPKPSVQLQEEGRRFFGEQVEEVDEYDSDLVEIMDDVAALVDIVIDDSSPMDTLEKTFDTIKDDFEKFPTVLRHRENELVKVMSDFDSLLEVRQDSSFIKEDFMQAMDVIKEDLNKLREEHISRGRFFEQSKPFTTGSSQTEESSTPASLKVSSANLFSSSTTESAYSSDVGTGSISVPGSVQIIPLNQAPKVTKVDSSQGRYFKKDEILGGKFQQHDSQVLNSSRFQAENVSSQKFGSLEQDGSEGLLAYVVRDKKNPSRQFLVPASIFQQLQSNI